VTANDDDDDEEEKEEDYTMMENDSPARKWLANVVGDKTNGSAFSTLPRYTPELSLPSSNFASLT